MNKNYSVIDKKAIERRQYWINKIVFLSDGDFVTGSQKIENEISNEVKIEGIKALLDHLRLCTAIPESYIHDSSQEKLYSKYTDALISECFKYIGLDSIVLKGRSDTADVEAKCDKYSFVADAKVFRLSRTAKNQKDFKVQAMDGWRNKNNYSMVVCPIYQLPTNSSQIYKQAIDKDVCIFTYTHLSVLIRYAHLNKKNTNAKDLLYIIFESIPLLGSDKDSSKYWGCINNTMLNYDPCIFELWESEKEATTQGIYISKDIAINNLLQEKDRILKMTKKEAIDDLIKMHKFNKKIEQINKVKDNNILLFK